MPKQRGLGVPRFKPGDRVEDSFLGWGTVVKAGICCFPNRCMVLFDYTPPMTYNMSTNPCLWWPGCHDRQEATDGGQS